MGSTLSDALFSWFDLFSGDEIDRLRAAAESFPMDLVLARYVEDFDVTEDAARAHARELKRYFILTALYPDRRYGMRGPLDDLWHTFLMFTESYREFSRLLVGPKRFLHHHPRSTPEGSAYRITYDAFWYDYEETFGEKPPESVWPSPLRERRDWEAIEREIGRRRKRNTRPQNVDDGKKDAAEIGEEEIWDSVTDDGGWDAS